MRARMEGTEVVTLKRPPANALDLDMVEECVEVLRSIESDPGVRAIVVTGVGKTFCAGLDLRIVPLYEEEQQHRLLEALNKLFFAVYQCRVPVVAAINGHAIAGGLVLALCCDWRIAAQVQFQVGLAEVRVGIPYPAAAIEVVRSELPVQIARRLVLSGESMSSAAALAAGLFDESAATERLLERALARARRLSENPPAAFATIKRQLRQPGLDRIRFATVDGREPLRGGWLSSEVLAAATKVLEGRRG